MRVCSCSVHMSYPSVKCALDMFDFINKFNREILLNIKKLFMYIVKKNKVYYIYIMCNKYKNTIYSIHRQSKKRKEQNKEQQFFVTKYLASLIGQN